MNFKQLDKHIYLVYKSILTAENSNSGEGMIDFPINDIYNDNPHLRWSYRAVPPHSHYCRQSVWPSRHWTSLVSINKWNISIYLSQNGKIETHAARNLSTN
jgi:hypothetical protein